VKTLALARAAGLDLKAKALEAMRLSLLHLAEAFHGKICRARRRLPLITPGQHVATHPPILECSESPPAVHHA
jgi:hypothetical protein